MQKTLIVLIFMIGPILTVLEDRTALADKIQNENTMIQKIISELKRGSLSGEAGLYYEGVFYNKHGIIEDDEFIKLDDTDVIVPYFQADYTTHGYYGFSAGAGITAYDQYNGDLERSNEMNNHDHFVLHKIYLRYTKSRTSLTVGRQELEESTFLGDYYNAFSLHSREFENLALYVAFVKEFADSDISKFIEFQNIRTSDRSNNDYLFATEATWNVVPEAIKTTTYYYHQRNLYDLYGAHIELFHETEKIGFGLYSDAYVTAEDNENGLRDESGKVKNSGIYHINPYLEKNEFTFASGYIHAAHRVGAREGDVIDDYFNPFNEGDKVYEPGADTWYGSLSYELDSFNVELVFGRTEYLEDSQSMLEEEFDIKAGLKFLDNLRLETEFAIVDSESPEGDFNLVEVSLAYEF